MPQHQINLNHYLILKFSTMVSDILPWDTKLGDNMIEYEMRSCLTVGFDCGHNLYPFCEIFNNHYNMMIPPSRSWAEIHKIDPQLGEGTNSDNHM